MHQPKVSFGVAWARKPLESETGYGSPVCYDIFINASPIFGIDGTLDLITCAGFIPVAGQIIKVVDIVLAVVGVDPILTLTASGSISFSGKTTIHYDLDANNGAIDLNTNVTMKLVAEASITLPAGVIGFIFSAGSTSSLMQDKTYKITGETGFTADFGYGIHFGKGPFIRASLGFSGMVLVGKEETTSEGYGGKDKVFLGPYTIIEAKPNLLGNTYYLNN